jgi:RNA polymerase-binding transcription factor DksA
MMHYRYLTLEQRENLETLLRSQHADDGAPLQSALGRLHQGDYGVCCGCGHDVEFVRLLANPWVLYCQACARLPRAANGEH